jgi:hypothetical protein
VPFSSRSLRWWRDPQLGTAMQPREPRSTHDEKRMRNSRKKRRSRPPRGILQQMEDLFSNSACRHLTEVAADDGS